MIGVVSAQTGVLRRLYALMDLEEEALRGALLADPDRLEEKDVFAELVACGERSRARPDEYALLIESIFEGYLLHYGPSRLMPAPDPDLRLLAGDYLYALGLSRLAGMGDLQSVRELADLITLCARAHASNHDGSPERVWRLTGALWSLSVLAIAGGPWPEHDEAKREARAARTAPAEPMLEATRSRARQLGLEHQLERALIAFAGTVEVRNTATYQP
jgi:hypothetical protein